MALDYAVLKAADTALGVADPAAAAAALNAQTKSAGIRDIQWSQVRDVLMNNFDWGTLVQVSQIAVGGTLPGGGTQTAALQAQAIAIRECCLYGGGLNASNSTVWTRVSSAGLALAGNTVGAISNASATAVGALRNPTVAVWDPPVTSHDVLAARSMP